MEPPNGAYDISKFRGRWMFLKKYETISQISNLINPKEPQSTGCKPMK